MAKPSPLSPADLDRHLPVLRTILDEIAALEEARPQAVAAVLRRHPRDGRGIFRKNHLVAGYRLLCERGERSADAELLRRIRARPVRTLSGVAPVTVLTQPWPCPGQCIFCPDVEGMPKSYLPDEPGAMRAVQNDFDPFAQTAGRIAALRANGHPTDKIELLVLGGSWSSYPWDYQEWFIRRCLQAMNEADDGRVTETAAGSFAPELEAASASRPPVEAKVEDAAPSGTSSVASLQELQGINESARCRNVGLVLETRPDLVDAEEVRHLRQLGATKIQMGAQSLDDGILRRNRRGHTVEDTRRAMKLLRAAGFKLVLHWMPNLLGATPESDREDFARLFDDEGLRPDEIKIYPTTLLEGTELFERWKQGEYEPYDDDPLTELVIACKQRTPRYCRINRIYRDIPSRNVVAGCRITNLRQHVHEVMRQNGRACHCLRCREVKERSPGDGELRLNEEIYRTRASEERFLSFDDVRDRCAAYLRLSLPDHPSRAGGEDLDLPELEDCALVRELHVFGQALSLADDPGQEPSASDVKSAANRTGRDGARATNQGLDPTSADGEPIGNEAIRSDAASQHRGLGRLLLEHAESIARRRGYRRMLAHPGGVPLHLARLGELLLVGSAHEMGAGLVGEILRQVRGKGREAMVASLADGYAGYLHLEDEYHHRPEKGFRFMSYYENALAVFGRHMSAGILEQLGNWQG